jgi:hypothetical protein
VLITKSIPNWISYLHEFSWNCLQHLAISFELFSFRIIFNSGIICHGVPPVNLSLSAPGPLVSTPSPRGATCHGSAATRLCSHLKGQHPDRDGPNAAATSRRLARHPDSAGLKLTAPPPLSEPQPPRHHSDQSVRSCRSSPRSKATAQPGLDAAVAMPLTG